MRLPEVSADFWTKLWIHSIEIRFDWGRTVCLLLMFASIWSIRPEVSHNAITLCSFNSSMKGSSTRSDFVKSVSSWSRVLITRLLLKNEMLSLEQESKSPVMRLGCFSFSSRLCFLSQASHWFVPPSTVILIEAENIYANEILILIFEWFSPWFHKLSTSCFSAFIGRFKIITA